MTKPVICTNCGQKGNEPPGLKVVEFRTLEAIHFDDGVLIGNDLPQKLVCNNCGKDSIIPRGSIEVKGR